MIMPANYSAIAENELSYVDGGFVPALTSVDILEKNIVEYIGNLYTGRIMNAFIGQWFADDGKANVFSNVFGAIGGVFTGKNAAGASNGGPSIATAGTTAGKVFAVIRNTIGVLAGVYVLGMNDSAVGIADANAVQSATVTQNGTSVTYSWRAVLPWA